MVITKLLSLRWSLSVSYIYLDHEQNKVLNKLFIDSLYVLNSESASSA